MDQQKLRNLVFEKTGIKVDSNDPIFALVALNDAVLAETVQRHVALIEAATAALTSAATPGHGHGAERMAPAVPFVPAPATPVRAIPTQGAPLLAPRELRLLGAAAGVAVLSAVLVLAGQALLFHPAAPAPGVVAPAVAALTPAQTAALADAKKLAAAVARLDPKSRSLIQAEMGKP